MAEDVEAPDPPLPEGTRVGDFRVRGLLGEGAMGQVYLAQDLTLGRRVALKLIRRSAMQGDAAERFLEEARATASFNHPHIVTLHAVGEHDGRPYLALEYVDGESLRARLAAGPLPLREALRHARAIAEAIAEAHRRGLVHADLKPENVVIPRDGRVRVVDFGLARLAGGTTDTGSGSPAYMAPERWRSAPPTGAIDVWALGVLLHELVAGRRPVSDAALAMLPFSGKPLELPALPDAGWAALVRDCLALDPAARPTADELVRRLTALLDPRAAAEGADDRCPFPGLAAFTRDDAADYFGRRAELDALVEQLRTRPLVPIVGPSGIGKSSFVRAALLPRLEEAGPWTAVALRPGAAPWAALAAALALPDRPAAAIAESLRRYPDSLSLVLGDLARHRGGRVLLFLDQFEEVFTLAAAPADAIALCDCIARAAAPGEPWRIVLTLRDDFLGRLAAAPAMRPHLGEVMSLAPLAPADLRAAVAGPLANAGYEPDAPELIGRIVDDVADQPACLPLLQFACRALWERRDAAARRILTAEYEAMGGATGALAAHAQRLLAELAPDEVRLVRGLLIALLHPDGTRRPRLRHELLDELPDAAREAADRLLDRLLERRLVVAARDAEQDAAALEVAHEALATAWPQLARWLDETYEERVLVAELEQAAQLWQRRGRRDDETWGGVALADAARKVAAWNISLPSVASAFLDASERRARRLRRLRRWAIGGGVTALTLVAFVAVLAAVAFARKEDEANRQRKALERERADAITKQRQLDLATADLGSISLELVPFDWDPDRQQLHYPAAPVQGLGWKLYATGADQQQEGREYEETDLHRGKPSWHEEPGGVRVLVEHLDVRSGPAFIKIDGRSGDCAPSVLFLQYLPGYRERRQEKPVRILVPTCQASRAGTAEIPAGRFYHVEFKDHDADPEDKLATLPTYRMDKTEVTRGAFEMFANMSNLTGIRLAPPHITDPDEDRNRHLPVSGIDRATARAYCLYMGMELPTLDQWQKAVRGGITIDGVENPNPKRLTPWLVTNNPRPANLALKVRDDGTVAPVATFPEDQSPYKIFDLAGNVREWSLDKSLFTSTFYRVHGASWGDPPAEHYERVVYSNKRPGQSIDYTIGVRCVSNH